MHHIVWGCVQVLQYIPYCTRVLQTRLLRDIIFAFSHIHSTLQKMTRLRNFHTSQKLTHLPFTITSSHLEYDPLWTYLTCCQNCLHAISFIHSSKQTRMQISHQRDWSHKPQSRLQVTLGESWVESQVVIYDTENGSFIISVATRKLTTTCHSDHCIENDVQCIKQVFHV